MLFWEAGKNNTHLVCLVLLSGFILPKPWNNRLFPGRKSNSFFLIPHYCLYFSKPNMKLNAFVKSCKAGNEWKQGAESNANGTFVSFLKSEIILKSKDDNNFFFRKIPMRLSLSSYSFVPVGLLLRPAYLTRPGWLVLKINL